LEIPGVALTATQLEDFNAIFVRLLGHVLFDYQSALKGDNALINAE
jgi:hypothetical protein